MTKTGRIAVLTMMGVIMSACVWAADIDISGVTISEMSWGNRTVSFNIRNNMDDVAYLTAVVRLSYSGEELTPRRMMQKSIFMEPAATAKMELPIGVVGNYGTCHINVGVYAVVDTLDILLESQRIFSHDISHTFPVPAGLKEAIDGGLMVPGYVDRTTVFDNHFGRILAFLLYRGKSVNEIAMLTGATEKFVRQGIDTLDNYGYVKKEGDRHVLTFNVITDERVKRLRPEINNAVAGLIEVLKKNLPAYDSTVQALVEQGVVTAQKDNIIDPGSILHHKHPVVLCLFLWNVLGREFVNNGNAFNIFQLSDPCNAYMADFMHLVSGPPENTGDGFYYFIADKDTYQMHCGTGHMPILCGPDYRERLLAHKRVDWSFLRDSSAVFYTYTDEKAQIPVSMLMDGAIQHVENLKKAVEMEFNTREEGRYLRGVKYWCWNLVVGEVMKELESMGLLEKEGFGTYSLQKALVQW